MLSNWTRKGNSRFGISQFCVISIGQIQGRPIDSPGRPHFDRTGNRVLTSSVLTFTIARTNPGSPRRPQFARTKNRVLTSCVLAFRFVGQIRGRPGDSPGRPQFARTGKTDPSVSLCTPFLSDQNGLAWATQNSIGQNTLFFSIAARSSSGVGPAPNNLPLQHQEGGKHSIQALSSSSLWEEGTHHLQGI